MEYSIDSEAMVMATIKSGSNLGAYLSGAARDVRVSELDEQDTSSSCVYVLLEERRGGV